MKKYLICGAMALAAGLFITSCTHDDIGYDNLYDEKTQTFDKVFKDLYGNIDPSHDWGFTPYVDITDASTTSSARAMTRGHNANANEWADPNKENGGWIVPNPLTNEQKNKVRQWFQTHKNPDGVAFSHSNFFVQQVYKGGDNVGDYSPEKYLAADGNTWMVGGEQMDKLTCGSYSEGAETAFYYDHINNFNNGTCSWNNDVLDNGQTVGGSKHSDQIMLMVNSKSDCFGYWNSNGSVGFNNKYVIIPGDVIQEDIPGGGDVANVSGMWFVGFDYEQLVDGDVYTNNYFSFENQQYRYLNSNMNFYCGDKKEYNNVPSSDVIRDLLSQGYLPVEGKADKVFVKLDKCADGYYSDWIVRVIPGTKKSTDGDKQKEKEETSNKDKYKAKRHVIMAIGRVFVEDLYNATRADIDYNDAVFDAIIWKDQDVIIDRTAQDTLQVDPDGVTKYRLEIALLAAGGTIPLTIGGSKFGDVHERFGVGLTTIVNTVGEASNVFGSSVTGHDYVYKNIDITDVINDWKGSNPITLNIIPIDVLWTTDNVTVAARLNNRDTHTYQKDDDGKLVVGEDGEPIIVSSDAPVVPHILQAPIGTAWPQERVNIGFKDEGPYHYFPNYVQNYAEYKGKVWKSNIDPFYLYADNRTPLAYSGKNAGYTYLTDIELMIEGQLLEGWTNQGAAAPVDLGTNFNTNVIIQPENLFSAAGLAAGDVIRLYCSKKADGDINLKVFGGHWEASVPISGWEVEYGADGKPGGTLISNAAKAVFNANGYIEIPVTSENIGNFTTISNWGGCIILQGNNLTLEDITIKKP